MDRLSLLLLAAVLPIAAQPDSAEFFEKKIRPVLATKCYACHSSQLKIPMSGLTLDTKAGVRRVVGRLLTALSYTDPHLQMPPSGKLSADVIADFQTWIAAGAPDPRPDAAPAPVTKSPALDLAKGRQWWSFQPVREMPAPSVKSAAWPRNKIDSFVLAKLEANNLAPSPQAAARILIRRASLDLVGVAPTYEQVEAFARDSAPDAYERLVERLLASPHYGERWGRYWLDVAQYAEDNPTNGPTNPYYPFAWRYRDWVIEALNRDVPYDRFVKLQLAADQMPGVPREDWRALGYLGIGPVFHKDARLSKEVLETFASDDWDERVDAVSRGLLGLTVGCARCHDHKFDPIGTKDYYGMAGVFASSPAVERPLFPIDPETETRFLWLEQRLLHLRYLAHLLTREPGADTEGSARKVARFEAEIRQLTAESSALGQRYPELPKEIERFSAIGIQPNPDARSETGPFFNAVYDAGMWLDGSDPDLTLFDYRPGKARDLPVFLHGSVATPGEPAPRRFPAVLSKRDPEFRKGSGRLELGERIFTDAAPLAARVMVNRVWAWHFGKPLVATPSDFGTQGEKPSHPELLDDLGARFVEHGWSLKWLHREIMLSAAYRQSSQPRPAAVAADPDNRLLWRMNPRRLDIEAYRDSILAAAGSLDETMYGPPAELDAAGNIRRTIYAKVRREKLHTIFRLYDLPDPAQHSPARDVTTTPLQQLFVMNSAFFQEQAAALAKQVETESGDRAKARALYRRAFARDPDSEEIDMALSYLYRGTLAQYAQALLAANEMIFWP